MAAGPVDQVEAGADDLGGGGQVLQAHAGQHPVDRTEEERGVLLVDEHRQAAVGRAAGERRCMRRYAAYRWWPSAISAWLAARPRRGGPAARGRGSPRPGAAGRCGPRSRRSGAPAITCCTTARTVAGARCTSRIGAGLSGQLGHPVGQLVGLRGMDPLVRQHGAVLRAGGPMRDVQRPDQAADGEPGGRVLVQVDRRLVVAAQLAALLPLREPGGDRPVRSGEAAVPTTGRRSAAGSAGPPRNGASRSGRPDVRRGDHGAGVHRQSRRVT